jgi:nitrilase
VCGLLSLSDVPPDFEFYDDLAAEKTDVIFAGGSVIVSPQGAVVAEIDPGIEGIIAYDIDMQAIRSARHNFDPAGHYARSDIFRVGVQRYRLGENAE